MIRLRWSPASDCGVQPNVSYSVAYHGVAHCGYKTLPNSTAALQETEHIFGDLEEYTNYTFNLTMYPGGLSVVIHVQTLPAGIKSSTLQKQKGCFKPARVIPVAALLKNSVRT